MPRSVQFTISRDGRVETEFSGFPGQECLSEAEALQTVLRKYGLKITNQTISMKSSEQLAHETGVEDEATGRNERTKIGHED